MVNPLYIPSREVFGAANILCADWSIGLRSIWLASVFCVSDFEGCALDQQVSKESNIARLIGSPYLSLLGN